MANLKIEGMCVAKLKIEGMCFANLKIKKDLYGQS